MIKLIRSTLACLLLPVLFVGILHAKDEYDEVFENLEKSNITWTQAGPSSAESMPLGNGDIGLNVWADEAGGICFYIAKTDAWNADVKGSYGLLKLAMVRISLSTVTEKEVKASFKQSLKLKEAEIFVSIGGKSDNANFRIWVDANNPTINVDIQSSKNSVAKVELISWRENDSKEAKADIFFEAQNNKISWCHQSKFSDEAAAGLRNFPTKLAEQGKLELEKAEGAFENLDRAVLSFGAVIDGQNFKSKSDKILESRLAAKTHKISIYPLTLKLEDANEWQAEALKLSQNIAKQDYQKRLLEHKKWWDDFWKRSWIFVSGDSDAEDSTNGYILQRFITACAGRGAYPIKFNGSLFNVDRPMYREEKRSADYRTWGGQYWFQNTRPMYWPRLKAGDFDIMLPLFKMYFDMMPQNMADVEKHYKHKGFYFMETTPFYGGLDHVAGREHKENWTAHYYLPVIELSMMMLDYYEFTLDEKFLKNILIPVATEGIKFYAEHFEKGADGKLLLDPCNSIEMFWKAKNPSPDIAGLRVVSARLLALPNNLFSGKKRAEIEAFSKIIPPLPTAVRNGKKVILPYEGEQTMKPRNMENPELYTIYPFRMFGIGKPNMQLALDTFNSRKMRHKGCWFQDPIQAAMLGLSSVAKEYIAFNFRNTEPGMKFPAFWANSNDYTPDQDNGGNGEMALQEMMMYTEGKKIYLLPAFPENWNAYFKLNAPYNTSIICKVKNGKLIEAKVSPASRKADIIDLSKQAAKTEEKKPDVNLKEGNLTNKLGDNNIGRLLPLKQTKVGQNNTFAEDALVPQSPEGAFDDNSTSKYFNKGQDTDGFNPAGVNTGLLIELNTAMAFNAIQFQTAPDRPERDPILISIEGSNDANAASQKDAKWMSLYSGASGLDERLERREKGLIARFKNAAAYKYYRILVIQVRDNSADGVQYSELALGNL